MSWPRRLVVFTVLAATIVSQLFNADCVKRGDDFSFASFGRYSCARMHDDTNRMISSALADDDARR